MKDFQSILKKLRENRGLSQYKLASELDMSQSNIGMYENGSRMAPSDVLLKIADYFNVSVDYLLGREKPSINHTENTLSSEVLMLARNMERLKPERFELLKQFVNCMLEEKT